MVSCSVAKPVMAALSQRVEIARERLSRLDDAVGPLAAAAPDLAAVLTPLLQRQRRTLDSRLDEVADAGWEEFADIEHRIDDLIDECQSFADGAAARGGHDRDAAAIATEMIIRFRRDTGLSGFTPVVLAARLSTRAASGLVRIQVPANGVWQLPLVFHELGHVLFFELRRVDVVSGVAVPVLPAYAAVFEHARIDAVAANPAKQNSSAPGDIGGPRFARFEELFADVFATYVAGPSFGYASLFALDPSKAGADDRFDDHPEPGKRFHATLRTLAHLEDSRKRSMNQAGFREVIDELTDDWHAQVAEASGHPIDAAVYDRVDACVDAYLEVLDAEVPTAKRANLGGAVSVRNSLSSGAELSEADSMLDLLDGAWLARRDAIRAGGGLRAIGDLSDAVQRRLVELTP
jgi:hypothetical protein